MLRSDACRLSDTELRVAVDGLRLQLCRAWERGQAGSLSALYDLAMLSSEADVRGTAIAPLGGADQLTLAVDA